MEATARLILESAPNGMLLVDGQGRIVAANPEAERLFGYATDELVGRPVEVLLPERLREEHPRLREAFRREPRTRAMGHGRDLGARRKDGSEFPVEVGLAVAPGAPGLVTCVVSDISGRKRVEEERARLLASERAAWDRLARLQSITEAGLAQLPVDELLRELLDRVMQALSGNSATMLLLDEERAHLVVVASHGLDERPGEGRVPVGVGVSGTVVRTARPRVVADLREADVHRSALLEAGLRSLLVAPLVVEGTAIGVLHVGSVDVGRFREDDLELLQPVADRVALAVDRARAFERERTIAETLQRSLLPDRLPVLDDAGIAARYLPGTSGMRVGGDWYDVVELPDGRVLLVIGDVMGRGVRAASVMGQLRSALRVYLQLGLPLPEVVARLNTAVLDMGESEMATLLLAAVQPGTGEVEAVCAGHPPPVVRLPGRSASLLEADAGVALGVTPDASYRITRSRLEPGGSILLYTDGLVERPELPLTSGLADLVQAVSDAPAAPEPGCDALVARFLPKGQSGDDVALLWLRLEPDAVPALDLCLPSTVPEAGQDGREDLAYARAELRAWLARAGADDGETDDLVLAVCEALSAQAQQPKAPPRRLTVTLAGNRVEAVVRSGKPAAPLEGSERGRGFVLLDAVTDGFCVQREDGCSEVRVVRNLRRGRGGDAAERLTDEDRGLVVPADPTSVPMCRRYVRERLAGSDAELVDTAELCVSELVTNAVVHAGTEIEVRVEAFPGAVRLEVRDGDWTVPRPRGHSEGATTGRGLELVGQLSDAWGVDPLPGGGGKAVWCSLSGGLQAVDLDADQVLALWADQDLDEPPAVEPSAEQPTEAGPEERTVVLRGYPVQLAFRAREHSDSVMRECVLLTQAARNSTSAAPARLVEIAQTLQDTFGSLLDAFSQQRMAAHARGIASFDMLLPASKEVVPVMREWRQVLDELDRYCAEGALLTPPRTSEVAALGHWFFDEFDAQLRGGAPCPWEGPLG